MVPGHTGSTGGGAGDEVVVLGARVRLSEVAAALARLPGVAGADATFDGRRLHAVVEPDPDAPPLDPQAMRAEVAHVLPLAAVPATITVVPPPAPEPPVGEPPAEVAPAEVLPAEVPRVEGARVVTPPAEVAPVEVAPVVVLVVGGVGTSPGALRPLADALIGAGLRPVVADTAPPRAHRSPVRAPLLRAPRATIDEHACRLVAALGAAARPGRPDGLGFGPLVVLGVAGGGVLAHEVSCRVAGHRVTRLALVDEVPPRPPGHDLGRFGGLTLLVWRAPRPGGRQRWGDHLAGPVTEVVVAPAAAGPQVPAAAGTQVPADARAVASAVVAHLGGAAARASLPPR